MTKGSRAGGVSSVVQWRVFAALGAMYVLACARPPRPTHDAVVSDRQVRIASYARAFRNAEPVILASMVDDDSRLLLRMAPKPRIDQVRGASDDEWMPSERRLWWGRGYVDPFMFTDREETLEGASAQLDSIELPADVGLRRELLDAHGAEAADPDIRALGIDQHLLHRVLASERLRVERERELPRAASDLVLAMIDAIPVQPSAEHTAAMDVAMAWRMDLVRGSLAPNLLSEAERTDLLTNLARLRSRAVKLGKAVAAIDKLVDALGTLLVAPFPIDDEEVVEHELTAFVGAGLSLDTLGAAFARTRATLATQVGAAFTVLSPAMEASVRQKALTLLFDPPPCGTSLPMQTTRDLAPPLERAWSCALVKATDAAKSDLDDVAALLALHDATMVASWAVARHGPTRAATLKDATLLALTPAQVSALVVQAEARPLRAIAAGLAAGLLVGEGAADVKARAHAWRVFGEAPLDVVAAVLKKNGT